MRLIKTEDAEGHVLCHDITQIIPGKFKGRAFKKGHIVKKEDIPVLKSLGKNHLYIWEMKDNMVHENEAAEFIRDIAMGKNLKSGEIKEGKIEFISECDGILKVNRESLLKFNMLGEMMMATLSNNVPVKAGERVAGTRIIPLIIEREKLNHAKEILKNRSIVQVIPYKKKKIGIVTSGNEVYNGIIKDRFGPVIEKKVSEYGCEVIGQKICPDDTEEIYNAIEMFLKQGADIVCCTGGMSVDPDDLTPAAIKRTNADIITYGAPVLPGAMFMLAYKENKTIMGIPGCAMYNRITVFDMIFSRTVAGEKLSLRDIAEYGDGGFCRGCDECRYPNCGFGK